MDTIVLSGPAESIDIISAFDDNYKTGLSFDFDEESSDTIDNVFLRIYVSNEKCSLEQAMEGYLEKMFGCLLATGQEYGYSEYTIEGFHVHSLRLGGHDLNKILKSKEGKYLHVLIDVVPSKTL